MKQLLQAASAALLLTVPVHAQLAIDSLSSTVTITFDSTIAGVNNGQFAGSGFQPTPTVGQLNSDAWAVTGWSDGNLAFGGTQTSGDYARGTATTAVSTGGMYAFGTTNRQLMIQPGGSDWAPGTLTLRILNNTGVTVTSWTLAYELFVRNDQPRSNSFNFSYSTDGITFSTTGLTDPLFSYTSPAAADPSPTWASIGTPTNTISATVANGAFFFIRWSGADVGGSGARDEFGIDNISVTAIPEPSSYALIGLGLASLIALRRFKRAA